MWGPHSPTITAKSILIKTQVKAKCIKNSKKQRQKKKDKVKVKWRKLQRRKEGCETEKWKKLQAKYGRT